MQLFGQKHKRASVEALEKALDDARQREKEISLLLDGARAILKYRVFSDSARNIFDNCKALIGATAGYVALLTDDGRENEVLFLDAGGLPCSVDEDLPMPIRGLRAQAYHQKRAVYDNDFPNSKHMRFMPEGHVELRNVMFAPLIIEEHAKGLLGLSNKDGNFTPHDAEMATAFGELAAIALMNSRLLESHKEHAEDLERFNASMVGRELRIIELKKEVNALCDETGRKLPYPSAQGA